MVELSGEKLYPVTPKPTDGTMTDAVPVVVIVLRPTPLMSPVVCVVVHATIAELGAQTGPPQDAPVLRSAPVASVRKCNCVAPVFEFVTFS